MITGCYRLAGTPNYPNAKKLARGRTIGPTRLIRVTNKVWTVDALNAAFTQTANTKLKATKTQPREKPAGALNGEAPIRSTPRKHTIVELKVSAKVTPKMDRSAQFQAAVHAAATSGMSPDDLETLMRKHPDGCAGKYLNGSDRLRQEIDRSWTKAERPVAPEVVADPDADGAILLEDVHAFLGTFIVYPSDHAHVAHSLWIIHAHLMDQWVSTPRIAFLSPEPASGKSRALEITELLVPNPVQAINVTPAYLFRKVGSDEGLPTLLYDEVDTVFGPKAKNNNEEVRALLNAGHRKGAVAGRCVVHGSAVLTEELSAYCAVALAGLGHLPDTISSRAVIIKMRRRAPNETVAPYRPREYAAQGKALHDRIAAWTKGAIARITVPTLPAEVVDRDGDVWESLITVADLAGGRWPAVARVAAVALVALGRGEREDESLGLRLLADLRTVFGNDTVKTTSAILDKLHKLDESPWADIGGKQLTDLGLSRRLRGYGIKPKSLRIGASVVRGYRRDECIDVWDRYLPPVS